MPTYTYACMNCKRRVDKYHRRMENSDERCPFCGGIMERVICFEGHINLVGQGFHKNDYADPIFKADQKRIEECEKKFKKH